MVAATGLAAGLIAAMHERRFRKAAQLLAAAPSGSFAPEDRSSAFGHSPRPLREVCGLPEASLLASLVLRCGLHTLSEIAARIVRIDRTASGTDIAISLAIP